MLAFDTPPTRANGALQHSRHVLAVEPGTPLHAVRHLTRAASASLLSLDRRDDGVTITAGTAPTAPILVSPEVRAALSSTVAFMAPSTQPLWILTAGGTRATLIVRLSERGPIALFLVLEIDDATALTRTRVGKLMPDLTVLLGSWLEQESRARRAEQQRSAAIDALDLGEVGVIAVRSDHTVSFANAAASAMLTDGTALHLRRGEVRPAHYGDVAPFRAALDAVIDAPRPARSAARRAFVMLLAADGDRLPMVVAIAPSGTSRTASEDEPVATIHLLAPSAGGVPASDVLCQLHGLSPVETRLVAHLCAGLTVSEAAGEMRVKVETARAYLKQIFGKTGTHRQTELTLLISRYARVVQGAFDFRPA